MENGECIGCVVCKLERSLKNVQRGYIAMLAVKNEKRKRGEETQKDKQTENKQRAFGKYAHRQTRC